MQSYLLELPGVDHFSLIENMLDSEDLLCKEILKVVQEQQAKCKTEVKVPNSGL